jgi:hypothetical protein
VNRILLPNETEQRSAQFSHPMTRPHHPGSISAAACLVLFGMAAMAQSPASSGNPQAAIAAEANPPIDARKDEKVFYIRSSGLIADSTFIAASLNTAGSVMSEQLAFLILQAADHPYRITVAGGNEAKTMRVIKDAFDSAGPVQLLNLDFTFIGSPKAAVRVEKLVTAVQGTFHTRPTLYP